MGWQLPVGAQGSVVQPVAGAGPHVSVEGRPCAQAVQHFKHLLMTLQCTRLGATVIVQPAAHAILSLLLTAVQRLPL